MTCCAEPGVEELYNSDAFRINYYKVLPCSKRLSHDWCACPFLHPAEKSRRRSLQEHKYSAIVCSDMRDKGTCPRGDDCPMTHTIFEYWLHPQRYRTLLCKDGLQCNRRVCFFAHSLAELRVPTSQPPPLTAAAAGGGPDRTVSNGSSAASSSSTWGSGSLIPAAATTDASGCSTPLVLQRSDLAQHSFDSSQLQRLHSGSYGAQQPVADYQSSPLPMLTTGLGASGAGAQLGCQRLPSQEQQQQQQLLQETLVRLSSLRIPAGPTEGSDPIPRDQQQALGIPAPPSPWQQQLQASLPSPGTTAAALNTWPEQQHQQHQQQQQQQAAPAPATVWRTSTAGSWQLAASPPSTPPGVAAVSAAMQAGPMVVLPVCSMAGWQQQQLLPEPPQQQQQQPVYSCNYVLQPAQVVVPAGQLLMLPDGSLLLASQQQQQQRQQ